MRPATCSANWLAGRTETAFAKTDTPEPPLLVIRAAGSGQRTQSRPLVAARCRDPPTPPSAPWKVAGRRFPIMSVPAWRPRRLRTAQQCLDVRQLPETSEGPFVRDLGRDSQPALPRGAGQCATHADPAYAEGLCLRDRH